MTEEIPTTFAYFGFLDPALRKVEERFWTGREDWKEVIDAVNGLAQDSLYRFNKIWPGDGRRVARAVLYLHILQNAQSAVTLLMRGMQYQAASLIRNALEALFKLAAIAKDQECFQQYAQEAIQQQISFGEAINEIDRLQANKTEKLYTPDDVSTSRARIRELKRALGRKVDRWDIRTWAERAGYLEDYLVQYGLWCQPVHASGIHVETFLVLDETETVQEINPLPRFDKFELFARTACGVILEALQHVRDLTERAPRKAALETQRKRLARRLVKLPIPPSNLA